MKIASELKDKEISELKNDMKLEREKKNEEINNLKNDMKVEVDKKDKKIKKLIERLNIIEGDNSKKDELIRQLKGNIAEVKKEKDNEIKILNKRISSIERDNSLKRDEINILKEEMKKVKDTLGPIQARKLAKSLLNQFLCLLDEEDKQTITNNRKLKWSIIKKRIEIEFKKYEERFKYKLFIEIIRKSVELIERGNNGAHSIDLELYKKEIYKVANKQKIIIPNSDNTKIFFLAQLGITDELFMKEYNYLKRNFDNEMKITNLNKDYDFDKFFSEKENNYL